MDCPEGNSQIRPGKLWLNIGLKIITVMVALWLINVLFVAVHETGHATVAAAFGATICEVQVSATGIDGSTTHTKLSEDYQTALILISGIVFSLAATLIAYVTALDLAVYIMGLRTLESAINYTQNSDMSSLSAILGQNTLLLTALISFAIILVVASTFHRRYTASKPVKVSDRLEIAGPTPAT